jgi:methylmalonyl-CoA mutase N-terminal domain/subunit
MGGALKAIEGGFIQREIQESAYRYQRGIESGDRVIVGVNRFQVAQERKPEILRVNPAVRERQMARLQALKARRDNEKAAGVLAALRKAAGGNENLMPLIIACVENYATLGEISDVLRGVFGEYREVMTV